jgi:phosphoserine phosphatase
MSNEMVKKRYKLVVFDMDGTLLRNRTIFVFAEKKGFMSDLLRIINDNKKASYEKTIEIAKLLKNMDSRELLEIYRGIPLQDHAEYVINELRDQKIKTAIATNSYSFVANDLKNRLNIDYAYANDLVIKDNIVTGEIMIHNKDAKRKFDDCKQYSICKSDVLDQLSKKLMINHDEMISIGDGKIDICMIKKAGLGIAFNTSEEVKKHANISTNDLSLILRYIRT